MNNKIMIFVLALLIIPLASATEVSLEMVQEQVNKTDTFQLNILAKDMEDVKAFEATLSYEDLEFVSIESEIFDTIESKEEVTIMGFGDAAFNLNGNETLATLNFKTIHDGVEEKSIEVMWDIKTKVTNDGTENITETITETITLPNNLTVDRTIQPGETFEYITFEDIIVIPESEVYISEISEEGNILEMTATSSGEKCFSIYSETTPYNILVDENSEGFTYENNLINFCTHFSTRIIQIDYNEPVPEPVTTEGSSSSRGGSSHNYEHQDDIIKATPKVEPLIPTEEIVIEPITQEQPKTTARVVEENNSNPKKVGLIVLAIFVIVILGYFVFREPKGGDLLSS